MTCKKPLFHTIGSSICDSAWITGTSIGLVVAPVEDVGLATAFHKAGYLVKKNK